MNRSADAPISRLLLAACFLLAATPLTFPRDHGAHPDAAVEWWYYTGHLSDRSGRGYGFQLTFFRAGELLLAHFAWTDVAARRFRYEEKAHLALPGIASSASDRLRVVNENWSAEEQGGVHQLRASGPDGELELALRPSKAPVLQGPGGLSRKGPGPNEYSHYVSITRFQASGSLSRKGAPRLDLSGTAWFDHEWGPGALPEAARGWDWFAVQLSDGSELMLYRIRDARGAATPYSSGTFVPSSGKPEPVAWSDLRFEETGHWVSPRSGARYPAGWVVVLESRRLSLKLEPLLADQELVTEKSTGVTYWEGACRVTGTRGGAPVEGKGYAELTGYAGRDVPGFPAETKN